MFYKKVVRKKFCNIHRKTPVLDSLFNKVLIKVFCWAQSIIRTWYPRRRTLRHRTLWVLEPWDLEPRYPGQWYPRPWGPGTLILRTRDPGTQDPDTQDNLTHFFIENLRWLLLLFGTSFLISTDRKVSVFGVCLARIVPALRLNTEIYFVNLRIQFECKKLRIRKILNMDFFLFFLSLWLKQKEQNLVIKIKRQQWNMTQP